MSEVLNENIVEFESKKNEMENIINKLFNYVRDGILPKEISSVSLFAIVLYISY